MLRPARALVVALSLSLLVLAPATASATGTTTEPTQPAEPAEPTGDPMVGAPAVGTCYQLTYDELMAVSTPAEPVDCGTRHTAQVLDVRTFPDGLDWDSSSKRLDRTAVKACQASFARVVKDDPLLRARTVVQFAYFYPDAAEKEAGARWFRCDITLRVGEKMLPLPEELSRVHRAGRIPDALGRCLTKKLAYTSCAKSHRYEHSGALRVTDVRGRTAQQQLSEAAARGCPRRTRGRDWLWSAAPGPKKRTYVVVCYQRG